MDYKAKNPNPSFSLITIILLLVFLALIGLAVWRMISKQDSRNESPVASQQQNTSPKEEQAQTEPTVKRPLTEAYEVTVPQQWVSETCSGNQDILMLAPDRDHLGKCQTERGGTVSISKTESNVSYDESFYKNNDTYSGVIYEPITIDGLEGYKVGYTLASDNIVGYPPVGTKVILYTLYNGNSSYLINYQQLPGDDDFSTEAAQIVNSFRKLP